MLKVILVGQLVVVLMPKVVTLKPAVLIPMLKVVALMLVVLIHMLKDVIQQLLVIIPMRKVIVAIPLGFIVTLRGNFQKPILHRTAPTPKDRIRPCMNTPRTQRGA
jgi:hypothetical protein